MQYTVVYRIKGLSCPWSYETHSYEEWAIRKAKALQDEDYNVLIFVSLGLSPVGIRKWVANRD